MKYSIILILLIMIALPSSFSASESFTEFGIYKVKIPGGMTMASISNDKLELKSVDDKQYVTITTLRLDKTPTFFEFERMCKLRVGAEMRADSSIFIEPNNPDPVNINGRYILIYSGGEKRTGRIFSCKMTLAEKEILTVYVESVNLDPKVHLGNFKKIIESIQ